MTAHIRIDPIHCPIKNVSRGNGSPDNPHSAVAAAAYLSRTRIRDERTGRVHRYSRKDSDIIHETILLPEEAPEWASNRSRLWNAVEIAERRKDARLAKTIEVAIPRDLPPEKWPALIETFAARFVEMGLPVHYAIHDDGSGHNPHAHMMMPTRALEDDGFADTKLEVLTKKAFVDDTRAAWADTCNLFLAATSIAVRLDHRSYKARGISKKPTTHRGRQRNRVQSERENPDMSHDDEERKNTGYTREQQEPVQVKKYGTFEQWIEGKREEFEILRQDREWEEAIKRVEGPTPEERQQAERQMLRDEAARLPATRSETERMAAARKEGLEAELKMEEQILGERMAYLERRDQEDYYDGLAKEHEKAARETPDHTEQELEKRLSRNDVDYRLQYEQLEEKFERMFRDPQDAIKRFNEIRESRGERRAVKILERKPGRISPTKDAFRAYFQHSTRERHSANRARNEVREAYLNTQKAEDRKIDAEDALERYRKERDRQRER